MGDGRISERQAIFQLVMELPASDWPVETLLHHIEDLLAWHHKGASTPLAKMRYCKETSVARPECGQLMGDVSSSANPQIPTQGIL